MDLFIVERYMGEGEGKLNQQTDETLRLKRLQRDIEDRKRKRRGDQNEATHVSLESIRFATEIHEESNKKKKKKASLGEWEMKVKKERRFSKEGTLRKLHGNKTNYTAAELLPCEQLVSPLKQEKTNCVQGTELSSDPDILKNKLVHEKRGTRKKVVNTGEKFENMSHKQFTNEGVIEENSKDRIAEVFFDSDTFSILNEHKRLKNREKNIKQSKHKYEKKLSGVYSNGSTSTEGGDLETMTMINQVEEKRNKVRKETKFPKGSGKNGKIDVSQEGQDFTEEMAEEENKETGYTVIGGHKKDKVVKKVQRVLPDWLAKPVSINSNFGKSMLPVEQIPYLDLHIIRKLQEHDINYLFPVQTVVIPAILSQMETGSCFGRGGYELSDICVCAPTGSGKTLAYVLPIVQSLLQRVVCHLRALIILPTKDLANQVKQVFEMFTKGTNLKVGLASGSKSFSKDQEQLVSNSSCSSSSRVDVLVCTPGRLVDHISSTPHFTLHHVRFFVIDEADRLLDQSYHGWLGKVLKAAYSKQSTSSDFNKTDLPICCNLQTVRNPSRQQTAASFATIQLPLQKLLFSATMTQSPEKLAPLQLHQPMLFTVTGNEVDESGMSATVSASSVRYTIPEGLLEYMTICNDGEKPLMVLYFLTQLEFQRVLCFASSLEATHRLCLLVKLYGGVQVAEYSSSLTSQQRKAILRDFRLGKLQLLICSDAMARGMDIQGVSYVISYDAPNHVRGYIHRIGRTARAGNKGTAITLLHSDEVYHFKELIQKTGREKIPKYNIKDDKLHTMVDKYQKTLAELQDVVKVESHRKMPQKGKQHVVKFLQEQFMNNRLQKPSEGNV